MVEKLRQELTGESLAAGRSSPVWMKVVGQREAELWRRAQKYLTAMTSSVAEDRLDVFVREYAEEHL